MSQSNNGLVKVTTISSDDNVDSDTNASEYHRRSVDLRFGKIGRSVVKF